MPPRPPHEPPYIEPPDKTDPRTNDQEDAIGSGLSFKDGIGASGGGRRASSGRAGNPKVGEGKKPKVGIAGGQK